MPSDPIAKEIDQTRCELLAGCGGDLQLLINQISKRATAHARRVESTEELNRRFPAENVDANAISALGAPWRDPIVEEVHRIREKLSKNIPGEPPAEPPRAKSA